ncbi:hypothetical protein E0H64_14175 [Rhizobium leguminosarum bv. viciae]|uniref:hypothetical protein n=1 Tax=Rhizobium leguminosarum TaxID=384 RepID=UPI00103F39A5|nr:hypothetical protein [Rhizobium leguminosarum]MBY5406788.1 hypothetical protein [Rhizobium leguminosarum]TBZ68472.1 hypothetical protein E0H64_14175 [Rhizobium leguminosarum bv. viciae]
MNTITGEKGAGSYPAFNKAHPPLMTNPDVFPPERSASARIGQPFRIQQKDFFGVHDQQYPWPEMRHDSPSQWQRRKDLQAAQKREVDHYLVIRNQYWALFDRRMYGAKTVAKVSYERGTTYSHKEAQHQSTTSRFGVDLGLNLDANIFGALLLAGGSGANPLSDSSMSARFSYDFSRTLEFTKSDEVTYHETEIQSTETTFEADTQYLYWQICNDVLLYRVTQQQADSEVIASGAFMNRVVSRIGTPYVQPFEMGPSTAPNNDASARAN